MAEAPSPRVALVVPLALATLALGIPLDATGAWWAQPVVSAWAWLALGVVATVGSRAHRVELVACVLLATAGELFLKDVWGLYEYRLGNLPLFIPAGHALVFAAASRMSQRAPQWLPLAVATLCVLMVGYGAWRGYDTFGLVWGVAFLAFVWLSENPRLCATLFLFALAIESYGTALGGWRYYAVEPWFGLTTTNPPVWIGAVYCTLETLVRLTSQALPRVRAGLVERAYPRSAASAALPSRCNDR
ncbi:MAG: hypothetical protein ABI880_04180 [Acidobacteriota bacterium]